VTFLRDLLLPRLADLRQRLEMARHETTVDDRLDLAEPSVRFRVQPRPGAFEDDTSAGSVLEVRLDRHPSPAVVGGLWLDPLATGPGEQVRVEADRLNAAWVDALLLDFLEKTLKLA
jgi:hypothetical protein